MATDAKFLRVQRSLSSSSPVSRLKECLPENEPSVKVRLRELDPDNLCDVFFLHSYMEGSWTAKLAERLRGACLANHDLGLSLTDWKSAIKVSMPVELGKSLRGHRHLVIVVTRAMLREDWPVAQRAIESLKDHAPADGRIVTILKE